MVVPVGHSQLPVVTLTVGKTVPVGALPTVVHTQNRLVPAELNIALCGHSHNKLVGFQTKFHWLAVMSEAFL